MILRKRIAGAFLCAGILTAGFAADSDIRLNSVGFLPDFPKKASIAAEASVALLRDAGSDTPVFRVKSIDTMTNSDTREFLRIADFSEYTTPGRYYLYVQDVGRSPPFTIGDDVYTEPYRTMMLGMYLWRCGTAVDATHNNVNYSHAACHTKDADLRYISGPGTRDATGGWHDAGDYNKYIVNSGVTVGLMLKAWEQFWFALENIDLTAVSQSGSIPEYLTEIKWNLDWVAKMQHDNGTVSHKISTPGFGGEIMPEAETDTRYFVPWGSAATASFTAMMALAARIYAPYDKPFADACLSKAKRSYEFLSENPDFVRANQDGFSTGGYEDNSREDSDDRLWATAELWETTGEERYLKDLEEHDFNRIRVGNVQQVTEWANVYNLACFTYLNSQRPERRQGLVDSMKTRVISTADAIVNTAGAHGYGRTYGTSYYWGANGAVASAAYTLVQAYRLTGDAKYRHTVQDALSHLLGRNFYGRSFVTRVGYDPPKNPHDRTSVASGKPWPGRLIGGPHNSKSGAPAQITDCATAARCWFDVKADYWTNEVAINWNSAMIYALSAALPGSGRLPAPCYPGQPECDGTPVRHTASPRPAAAAAKIKTTRVVRVQNGRIDIPPGAKVYSLDGRLVAHRGTGNAKMPEIRTNGVYIIRVDNSVNARNSGGGR